MAVTSKQPNLVKGYSYQKTAMKLSKWRLNTEIQKCEIGGCETDQRHLIVSYISFALHHSRLPNWCLLILLILGRLLVKTKMKDFVSKYKNKLNTRILGPFRPFASFRRSLFWTDRRTDTPLYVYYRWYTIKRQSTQGQVRSIRMAVRCAALRFTIVKPLYCEILNNRVQFPRKCVSSVSLCGNWTGRRGELLYFCKVMEKKTFIWFNWRIQFHLKNFPQVFVDFCTLR